MPRLRRYIHVQNYYISGQVPEIGFCTWQIGKEGLEYLKSRGVFRDGDLVSPGDLRDLRDRRLVWSGGKGPGGKSVLLRTQPGLAGLVADLERWALHEGGLRELTE